MPGAHIHTTLPRALALLLAPHTWPPPLPVPRLQPLGSVQRPPNSMTFFVAVSILPLLLHQPIPQTSRSARFPSSVCGKNHPHLVLVSVLLQSLPRLLPGLRRTRMSSCHILPSDCSRVRRVEPHIHPRSQTHPDHSFRSLPFLRHLLHLCLLLMTPLPNVPQLHLQTRDLRGPGRVRPLLNLHMG